MRFFSFFLSAAITIVLLMALDRPLGPVPAIGRLLSPQTGFWRNADPTDMDYSADLHFDSLKGKVNVYLDERLVPHLFAERERDAFFVQGYLHARFRLWQMEFQTHAAAGRLSEVLGVGPDSAFLKNDRYMRRLGMVAGAKRSLEVMLKDSNTAMTLNAYTAGANAFIGQLASRDFPIEYKLLGYAPEPWTNLKTALFLKYMSYDLTGSESDIEYTNAKTFFSLADLQKLYPLQPDSLDPIIPKGTAFPPPGIVPRVPAGADTAYFNWRDSTSINPIKSDRDNGSNNWVVAGSKTKSGRPILCNDPHLGLNLPSLWYEMQITTPGYSTYGVSFPGAPSIVIGYNENIAWGVTNAARDVMDYYEIRFRDESHNEYRYNNEWSKAGKQVDVFRIKGGAVIIDTVATTVFGPVIYDEHFRGRSRTDGSSHLAVKWKAQEGSNELKTFYLLNQAKNYQDYLNAIKGFICPGQNFAFASRSGDIAIWHQGSFPAKWKGQGDYIMPGTDSSYRWQGNIPQAENPHLLNPARGFVSSANQLPADSSYPYYLGGSYDLYRGLIINRKLGQMDQVTPADMQKLQNDNYNVFAANAVPLMLAHLDSSRFSPAQLKYVDILHKWNFREDNEERGVAIFTTWFDQVESLIWQDELSLQPPPSVKPDQYTLLEALIRDSSFSFINNIKTPAKETLTNIVTRAWLLSVPKWEKAEEGSGLTWNHFKDAGLRHLLRLEPFSRYHLNTGGGVNVINALKQFHGPSWRMVVEMKDEPEAYGIYPGGQSGNPGSKYYDGSVDNWSKGQYYKLWKMKQGEEADKRIRFQMNFNK